MRDGQASNPGRLLLQEAACRSAGTCGAAQCLRDGSSQPRPSPKRRTANPGETVHDRRDARWWGGLRRIGPQAVPGRHRNSRRSDRVHRGSVGDSARGTHRAERTRRMPRIRRPAYALRLHAAGQRKSGEPSASGCHHRGRRTVRPQLCARRPRGGCQTRRHRILRRLCGRHGLAELRRLPRTPRFERARGQRGGVRRARRDTQGRHGRRASRADHRRDGAHGRIARRGFRPGRVRLLDRTGVLARKHLRPGAHHSVVRGRGAPGPAVRDPRAQSRCALRPRFRRSAVHGAQRLGAPADLAHPAEVRCSAARDGAQSRDDRVGAPPGGRRRVRRHSPRLGPYAHQGDPASLGAGRRRPGNPRTAEGPRYP